MSDARETPSPRPSCAWFDNSSLPCPAFADYGCSGSPSSSRLAHTCGPRTPWSSRAARALVAGPAFTAAAASRSRYLAVGGALGGCFFSDECVCMCLHMRSTLTAVLTVHLNFVQLAPPSGHDRLCNSSDVHYWGGFFWHLFLCRRASPAMIMCTSGSLQPWAPTQATFHTTACPTACPPAFGWVTAAARSATHGC